MKTVSGGSGSGPLPAWQAGGLTGPAATAATSASTVDPTTPGFAFSQQDPYYTGAQGGLTQDPSANNLLNIPQDAYKNPYLNAASWGMSAATDNLPLYAGSEPISTINKTKLPMLLGQIATALGIKGVKGKSMEEQIIGKLAFDHGVQPFDGKNVDGQLLGQLVGIAQGRMLLPGKSSSKSLKLDDPTAWQAIASLAGVNPSPTTTGTKDKSIPWQQAALSLTQMSSDQIKQVQGALFASGQYDPKVANDPTLIKEGNLDPYTIKAFGTMLNHVAQANAQGTKQTWDQYLATQASGAGYTAGNSLSDYLNSNGGSGKQAKTLPQASQAQLADPLRKAFEADIGYAPSAQDLQNFTGQYDNMQAVHAGQASSWLDANGTPVIPGIPGSSAAPGNYAVGNYQGQYLAHQMANVAALVQNAMVSNRPLNSDPNITTAGRQI